jgi:hypothetical protein
MGDNMYTIEYHLTSGHTIAMKAQGDSVKHSYSSGSQGGSTVELCTSIDTESGTAKIFLAADIVAISVKNDAVGDGAATEAFARALEAFTPTLKAKGLMPR